MPASASVDRDPDAKAPLAGVRRAISPLLAISTDSGTGAAPSHPLAFGSAGAPPALIAPHPRLAGAAPCKLGLGSPSARRAGYRRLIGGLSAPWRARPTAGSDSTRAPAPRSA